MARSKFFDDLEALFSSSDNSARKKVKPFTWNDFLKKTGDDLDNRLIAHAKKEGLLYVGGKCRFTATADENNAEEFIVNVDAELYYKDQFKADKNFQLYPLHTEKPFSAFDMNDVETAEQLEKLKSEQFEMTVAAPQIKTDTEE